MANTKIPDIDINIQDFTISAYKSNEAVKQYGWELAKITIKTTDNYYISGYGVDFHIALPVPLIYGKFMLVIWTERSTIAYFIRWSKGYSVCDLWYS